jgi:predicted AlkP superfamily pyrophosphatase or phosphodiesterase
MLKQIATVLCLVAGSVTAAEAPSPLPKLVVVVSIDQLSSNLYAQYRDDFTAGFKMLEDGGITYASGYQSHTATETCPGHATLLTGRRPSGNGIVANQWYDKASGKDIYCTVSAGHRVPGSDIPSGPANLMATTLGDWLKDKSPQNRVFAVAGKDRSAIMMAGHKADGVYWFERGVMKFNTYLAPGETDYDSKIAAIDAFNSRIIPAWQKSPPVWTLGNQKCLDRKGAYTSADYAWDSKVPPAGYVPLPGQPFAADKAFAAAMRASPAYDQLIADAAIDLMKTQNLGRGAGTDVIAIGLSATDYIGHAYGNQGVEMCDHLLKLDVVLGDILKAAEAQGPFVLVLTADHGGLDAVERLQSEGEPHAFRADPKAIFDGVNAAVRAQLKLKADPFTSVGAKEKYPEVDQLHFTAALPMRKQAKAVAAARTWLLKNAPVDAVFSQEDIRRNVPAKSLPADEWSIANRVAVNYYAGRSGDLYIVFKPYGAMPANRGYVAGHGSPYDYDRRVPILFYGAGISAQERPLPIEVVDIAPTLAHVLGMTPPVPVDGRCLTIGNFASGPCPVQESPK